MTKITTDFVGNETTAVTKQRLTDILAYWGASTAAYTTWGQARTALNVLLTSTTAGTIGSTELAGSFLPKINFLNDPDDMIADALFGAGEQGVWLDPSDLTTMFQDAAGTTPVTAPGQPVGLRLDKSKGLVLGAELVSNGTFDTNIDGWTADGTYPPASAVWSSGSMVVTGNAGNHSAVKSPVTTVVGKSYRITASVTDLGYTSISNSPTGGWSPLSAVGYFVATATTTYIVAAVQPIVGAVATFDNISVKELPGNHATQSTAGSRPMYGIEPKGGRRNLLTWSEDWTNAVWSKDAVTVTADAVAAPNGMITADKLVETTATGQHRTLFTLVTTPAGYAYSVYLKAAERTFAKVKHLGVSPQPAVTVDLSTGALSSQTNVTTATATDVGNGWWRVSITYTTTTTTTSYPQVEVMLNSFTDSYTGTAGSGILIWGAQLELGSTATPYQRVTRDEDVTEAGVNSCHYCQYDGSDDGMVTNSIDFTATDKMSVFAGVRKNNDNLGVVAELGPVVNSTDGTFFLGTFTAAAFGSRGTAYRDALFSPAANPSNFVLTGLGDISGDRATLRRNGVQVAQNTGDQGTGNYGNFVLNFGRRNNSALGMFNGRDYGILVVGKAATSVQISTTEMWLANKTAGVTI